MAFSCFITLSLFDFNIKPGKEGDEGLSLVGVVLHYSFFHFWSLQ